MSILQTKKYLTAVVAVIAFSFTSLAQHGGSDSPVAATLASGGSSATVESPAEKFANIKIGNFGQMDERYYRGAQPLQSDYQSLKDLGVKTVIDLRNDPTDYEKPAVEALGMKYVNIPMSGWRTPKMESINRFLAILDDPSTGVVYVHCKAGKHRAGVAGAAYRYTKYDWDYDQVYAEMKKFNYSNGLWHGALGSFVKKWGKRLAEEKEEQAKLEAKAAGSTVSVN